MTYQEVQDRLTKVQSALTTLQSGNFDNQPNINVPNTMNQLQEMEKSLQSQLTIIAEKEGMVATDDEKKAQDLAKKGVNVKLTSEMKPGDEESLEHERLKRLTPKDRMRIKQIRALMQREKDAIEKDARKAKGMMEDEMEEGDGMSTNIKPSEGDPTNMAYTDKVKEDTDVGHQDDEPDMLKQYAYDIATYAAKLYKQLDKYDKMDGEVDFPNWWQSKVILAKDYIAKAQHYLEFEEKQPAIDALALEESVEEASANKIKKEYDELVAKMKQLAQHYKTAEGEKKEKIVAALKQHTGRKRELEAQLDKAVAKTGVDQELDVDEAGPGFAHDCAAQVVHEKYGKGICIPEKHTLVKEGKKYVVTHYDVLFESGKAVENIPVNELDIKTSNEHWHKGYKKKNKD
tara:strand:+ start:757 stop:1962 length:1206 start_codon:yes stop_codon:yes gene_type:complete